MPSEIWLIEAPRLNKTPERNDGAAADAERELVQLQRQADEAIIRLDEYYPSKAQGHHPHRAGQPLGPHLQGDRSVGVALLHGGAFSRGASDFNRLRISDGDTLSICSAPKECQRIRLAGIDAPERTQPYSQISRKNLVRLCQQAEVKVDARKIDKYGRTIGRVTCDGVDVQREQLKAGLGVPL